MGRPKIILDTDEIIENAAAIIRKSGHQTLSMRKLSNQMNIGTMTIYGYFESKKDLLKNVIVKEYKLLWKGSKVYAFNHISEGDNALLLYRFIFEFIATYAVENPNIYELMFNPHFNDFRDDPEVMALYSFAPNYIGEFLKDGDIDKTDIRKTLYMYEVLMNSFIINLLNKRGNMNPLSFEEMSIKAYHMLMHPLENYYRPFARN